MRRTLLAVFVLGIAPAFAVAEPIAGVWRTEPDSKGQKGHVTVQACGSAWCGTLTSVETADGAPTTTRNVGRRILIGMAPQGGGAYAGEVYVPVMGSKFGAEARVSGNQLRLRACNGMGVCRNQTWMRMN